MSSLLGCFFLVIFEKDQVIGFPFQQVLVMQWSWQFPMENPWFFTKTSQETTGFHPALEGLHLVDRSAVATHARVLRGDPCSEAMLRRWADNDAHSPEDRWIKTLGRRIYKYAAMTCFHGCKGNDELNILLISSYPTMCLDEFAQKGNWFTMVHLPVCCQSACQWRRRVRSSWLSCIIFHRFSSVYRCYMFTSSYICG